MLFPEGLRTVKWDRTGKEIVDTDEALKALVKCRIRTQEEWNNTVNFLGPLDHEELAEEVYNVMA